MRRWPWEPEKDKRTDRKNDRQSQSLHCDPREQIRAGPFTFTSIDIILLFSLEKLLLISECPSQLSVNTTTTMADASPSRPFKAKRHKRRNGALLGTIIALTIVFCIYQIAMGVQDERKLAHLLMSRGHASHQMLAQSRLPGSRRSLALTKQQQLLADEMPSDNQPLQPRPPHLPRVLLFITTIFAEKHLQHFSCCWPKLMEQSHLLPHMDVMIFSNNTTRIPKVHLANTRYIFRHNPSYDIKWAPPDELETIRQAGLESGKLSKSAAQQNAFQMGANLGLKLGFQHGWFQDYDWIIRINPDVIIRNSTFLVETMSSNDRPNGVDAILVDCNSTRLGVSRMHTDFFAIRPAAVLRIPKYYNNPNNNTPFSEMSVEKWNKDIVNHEKTFYESILPLLRMKRHRWLPGTANSRGHCRVRGPGSPVSHSHDNCRNDTHRVCHALEGRKIV